MSANLPPLHFLTKRNVSNEGDEVIYLGKRCMVIFFFQHPFHVTLMSLFRDQFEVSHENHTFGNCHDCYHTPEPILLPIPIQSRSPKSGRLGLKRRECSTLKFTTARLF